MEYVVVVEKAGDGSFSAYVPDLPGCVATGDTPEEVRAMIEEAVALHIDSLRSHGEPVPKPRTTTHTVHAA
jgi:predicted RNase H-like HicB family nuclease